MEATKMQPLYNLCRHNYKYAELYLAIRIAFYISSLVVTSISIIKCFSLVAVAGFERTNYTFSESDSMGKICVVVTNPPREEELVIRIELQASSRDITARKVQFQFCNALLNVLFFNRVCC